MTKPGYLGHLQNTTSAKYQNLFSNQNKVRQFIKGNLPRNQLPTLVTNKAWDWKKHIYPPTSVIANHTLELYDRNSSAYDALSGVWLLSDPSVRQGHGTILNLQEILNYVRNRETGKIIVFISGCRGDPTISQQSLNAALALNQNGYARVVGPQTYNIPLTNYLKSISNLENQSARFMRLKRSALSGNNINRVKRLAVSVNNLNRLRGNAGSSSGNNGTSLNLSVNLGGSNVLNKYKKMITRIQTPTFGVVGGKQLQVQAARKYFPYFFNRRMTNENVSNWISSIKRNNTNLSNRMTTLWKYEVVQPNWKNNRTIVRRILYKIKNIERNAGANRGAGAN